MANDPSFSEPLTHRLMPNHNPDLDDRNQAWCEWQESISGQSVMRFIRYRNYTSEADEDILQEALVAAFYEVEHGRYEQRDGIPFAAYVKGIAFNKLREARRRERQTIDLDEVDYKLSDPNYRPEQWAEQREQHAALRVGLGMLPDSHRQVLEFVVCGYSTSEIAAKLNVKETLVRQHKSRAVRQLRAITRV